MDVVGNETDTRLSGRFASSASRGRVFFRPRLVSEGSCNPIYRVAEWKRERLTKSAVNIVMAAFGAPYFCQTNKNDKNCQINLVRLRDRIIPILIQVPFNVFSLLYLFESGTRVSHILFESIHSVHPIVWKRLENDTRWSRVRCLR